MSIHPWDDRITKTSKSSSVGVDVFGFGSSNQIPGIKLKNEDGNGGAFRYGIEGQGKMNLMWTKKDGESSYKFDQTVMDSQIGPNNQGFLITPDLSIANSGPEVMYIDKKKNLNITWDTTTTSEVEQNIENMIVTHTIPLTKRQNILSAGYTLVKNKAFPDLNDILGVQSPVFDLLKPTIKNTLNVGENYKIQRGAMDIKLSTTLKPSMVEYLKNNYVENGNRIAKAKEILKDPSKYPDAVIYTPLAKETKTVNMGHRQPTPVLTHNYGVNVSYARDVDFKGLQIDGHGNLLKADGTRVEVRDIPDDIIDDAFSFLNDPAYVNGDYIVANIPTGSAIQKFCARSLSVVKTFNTAIQVGCSKIKAKVQKYYEPPISIIPKILDPNAPTKERIVNGAYWFYKGVNMYVNESRPDTLKREDNVEDSIFIYPFE
mgnify:FL=1